MLSLLKMSFYLTLPSDSSLDFYSENKLSHFFTRLPQPIQLTGEWEVGLTEIIYPHMWNNVNDHTNEFAYDIGNGILKKGKIATGYYENPAEVIKAFNPQNFQEKIVIAYNKNTKRIKVNLKKNARLVLPEGLAEKLGFLPGEVNNANEILPSARVVESPFIVDLNSDFHLFYLYTDIVEPQVIGDVQAPLLRIITVRGQDGGMIHELFDRPHYVPILRKNFQTIEIVIRTHSGQLVSFARGKLIVKLHFRLKHL